MLLLYVIIVTTNVELKFYKFLYCYVSMIEQISQKIHSLSKIIDRRLHSKQNRVLMHNVLGKIYPPYYNLKVGFNDKKPDI